MEDAHQAGVDGRGRESAEQSQQGEPAFHDWYLSRYVAMHLLGEEFSKDTKNNYVNECFNLGT